MTSLNRLEALFPDVPSDALYNNSSFYNEEREI